MVTNSDTLSFHSNFQFTILYDTYVKYTMYTQQNKSASDFLLPYPFTDLLGLILVDKNQNILLYIYYITT